MSTAPPRMPSVAGVLLSISAQSSMAATVIQLRIGGNRAVPDIECLRVKRSGLGRVLLTFMCFGRRRGSRRFGLGSAFREDSVSVLSCDNVALHPSLRGREAGAWSLTGATSGSRRGG
jgi:hypothetical protein